MELNDVTKRCPNCCYCKEGGRSDRTVPYFPPPYQPYQPYPWYPTAPFWYTNVGAGTSDTGNLSGAS